MSFIDMAYLKKSDLKNGIITYRRRKTGQQLTVKWEKCMEMCIRDRFFNGNAPENVNAIFGSKEAIEEYKQSIGDEAIASLRLSLIHI